MRRTLPELATGHRKRTDRLSAYGVANGISGVPYATNHMMNFSCNLRAGRHDAFS